MHRAWIFAGALTLAIVAVIVVWNHPTTHVAIWAIKGALGVVESAPPIAPTKPICATPVNPSLAAPIDCIPQHMAKLPPDPGKAGETQFIDVDKDGLRDDVQRKMAERWGDSPLAMAVLTRVALSAQLAVQHGGDLPKEEALKLRDVLTNAGDCYALAAPQAVKDDGALEKTQAFVMNTYERTKRLLDFSYNFAHQVYPMSDAPTAELCGFDPAAFPN